MRLILPLSPSLFALFCDPKLTRVFLALLTRRKKEYELSKAALSDELPLFDVKPEIPMAIPRTPISAPVSVPARNSLGSGSKSNVIQRMYLSLRSLSSTIR